MEFHRRGSLRRHHHPPRRPQLRRGALGPDPAAPVALRSAEGHSGVRLYAPPRHRSGPCALSAKGIRYVTHRDRAQLPTTHAASSFRHERTPVMKPYNHTLNSARGWYAGAPRTSPSISTPNSAQASRSNASTNSATNRPGWSNGNSSSSVGGNIHICSRPIGRSGISASPN